MKLSEPVLAEMRETNQLFEEEVIRKRNTDALDHVYTTSARILPPGAPMIAGHSQIKAFWQQAIIDLGLKSAKLATVEAEMLGDSLIEIGRAELTVGGGQIIAVKYVVHWKQEEGAWKWNVDIWNLDE
jgi:ketosteroid isomerase-like protein